MNPDGQGSVGECRPAEAWQRLSEQETSALVDVRTRPEWSFVGIPDLSGVGREVILLEWRTFPDMAVDPEFPGRLRERFEAVPDTIFFICRSGARSMEAARAVSAAFGAAGQQVTCVNVAEGFEGVLDDQRHRGNLNGWKAAGLPWRQS